MWYCFRQRKKNSMECVSKCLPSTNGITSTVRCGICYGSIGEVCCTAVWQNKLPIHEVRVDLLPHKGQDVPPTQRCHIEHVRRVVYQAGYCWSQSLLPMADLSQPKDGAGPELLKVHGKFFGANSLRQAKCAESSYAVIITLLLVQQIKNGIVHLVVKAWNLAQLN